MAIVRPLPLWKGQGQGLRQLSEDKDVFVLDVGECEAHREAKGDQKPREGFERMGSCCLSIAGAV